MVHHFRYRMKELNQAREVILTNDKKKLHSKFLIAVDPDDQVDDTLLLFASGLALTPRLALPEKRDYFLELVEHEE